MHSVGSTTTVAQQYDDLRALTHAISDSNNSNEDHSIVNSVTMLYPTSGSVVQQSICIRYDLSIVSEELIASRLTRLRACVAIDRAAERATWCYPVLGESIHVTDLSPGVHVLQVVVVETNEVEEDNQQSQQSETLWSDISPRASVLRASDVTHFTVLSKREFAMYANEKLQRQRRQYRLPPPEHDDLVKWTHAQRMMSSSRDTKRSPTTVAVDARGEFVLVDDAIVPEVVVQPHRPTMPSQQYQQSIDHDERSDPFVVVGVKTSVIHGFAQRQGIRESWASASARHPNVRVVFLGCRPDISERVSRTLNTDRQALADAIEIEKRTFRDLLTHELDCDDSYYTLTDKVKAFLHFATTAFPSAAYFMVADDDVYLRTHELVALIHRESWPRTRVYAGYVVGVDTPTTPIRDPGHKNYLAFEQYTLDEMPSFALGYHFLLSRDCAMFIARNRKRLHGLAHLDDASVALWMLALQVHPRHVDAFKGLRVHDCVDSAVSLADLSSTAMRIAHASLVADEPLCTHYDRDTWHKTVQQSFDAQTVAFSSLVERNDANHTTRVLVNVTSDAGMLQFAYDTATMILDDAFMHALCLRLKVELLPAGFACTIFARQLQRYMLAFTADRQRDGSISSTHLALWRHNLQFVGERAQPIVAVVAPGAMQYKSMLECLLTAVYRQQPIRVLDEAAFAAKHSAQTLMRAPDIVAFADSDCESYPADQATQYRQTLQTFIDRYGDTTKLIMVPGEPRDVDTLDERVLLLSTVSNVARRTHVYVPMASMAFSSLSTSPMVLLESNAERIQRQHLPSHSERKFCACMYARCDHLQQEYMVDLLNAMERVDALGVCQGSTLARRQQKDDSIDRIDSLNNEHTVEMFAQYKFVIAFENAQLRPGYVAEKIVTAFLAGSIPVYLGHSRSLARVFNLASLIDCGTFATLRACALRVLQVHQSPELYARMLHEPVVANATRFLELFSWHPDVPSSYLPDAVAKLLLR